MKQDSAARGRRAGTKLTAAGATAEVRPDGSRPRRPPHEGRGEGSYAVWLQSFGASKIQTIKVVKDRRVSASPTPRSCESARWW